MKSHILLNLFFMNFLFNFCKFLNILTISSLFQPHCAKSSEQTSYSVLSMFCKKGGKYLYKMYILYCGVGKIPYISPRGNILCLFKNLKFHQNTEHNPEFRQTIM